LDLYHNVELWKADGSIFPNTGGRVDELTRFGSQYDKGTGSGRWSPNGLKLIFDAPGNSAEWITHHNIWVMNADGSEQTSLTNNYTAESVNPHWSPDGSEVAFSSSLALDGSDAINTNGTVNIWVMKADGSGVRPLTKLTAAGADCRFGIPFVVPAVTAYIETTAAGAPWSPDGAKLAFECGRALDGSDSANANLTVNIWVVNEDGTGAIPVTNLTAAGASSHDVVWSPDGSKLAFDSFRAIDGSDLANAASNIWIMNFDGSGATRLTKNTTKGADSVQPKWHP
jgi:Tol biopolymer transport system component